MKGLKKDHQLLTELMFAHMHTLQHNLALLLESLSSIYPSLDTTTLLKDLVEINITEQYLLAQSSDDTSLLSVSSTILSHSKSLHSRVIDILSLLPEQSLMEEFAHLSSALPPLITRYTSFLTHCLHMTQFNASPYSGADVMVVGFDAYDEEYETLLDELYAFGSLLDDWTEGLVKGSYQRKTVDEEEEADNGFDLFTIDGFELDDSTAGQCPNFGIGVF